MTRDNTTSFQSDDVEDVGKINNDLMIETGVTNKNNDGQLKDESGYLLNDAEDIFQDKIL